MVFAHWKTLKPHFILPHIELAPTIEVDFIIQNSQLEFLMVKPIINIFFISTSFMTQCLRAPSYIPNHKCINLFINTTIPGPLKVNIFILRTIIKLFTYMHLIKLFFKFRFHKILRALLNIILYIFNLLFTILTIIRIYSINYIHSYIFFTF